MNPTMMITTRCVYQLLSLLYFVPSSLLRFREEFGYNLYSPLMQQCELINPTMIIKFWSVYSVASDFLYFPGISHQNHRHKYSDRHRGLLEFWETLRFYGIKPEELNHNFIVKKILTSPAATPFSSRIFTSALASSSNSPNLVYPCQQAWKSIVLGPRSFLILKLHLVFETAIVESPINQRIFTDKSLLVH